MGNNSFYDPSHYSYLRDASAKTIVYSIILCCKICRHNFHLCMILWYNGFIIFIKGIVDRPKQSNTDGKPESKRLQNLQSFQVYLLRYALFNFPNAKRIIYSTCSLHPEENEEVVDEVLADIGNAYRLVPVRQLLKNNWTNFSSKKYNCVDACLYSKPDDDFCNGFFVAVFERNFDVTLSKCKLKGGNEFRNLIKTNLNIEKVDMAKATAYKREKCGKKKKKKKKEEEISTSDEQMKMSTDIMEFKVPEIDSKVEAKRSKNTWKKKNVHSDLFCFKHKLAPTESKDTQKETLENKEMKKSKKKRLKHENLPQVEISYDGKEQKEEIKIDDFFSKKEQDEETLIETKKRKRNKEKC